MTLLSGLLSLWEFADNVNDSIGANHLTVGGTESYAAAVGNLGKGFSFNGSTDLTKTTPSNLSPTSAVTVGIALKLAATAAALGLVDREGGSTGFGLYLTGTTSLAQVSINGGAGGTSGGSAIDDGNLHFVMFTYDKDISAPQGLVYVDNSQVATFTYSTAISFASDPNLAIGGTGGANRVPNGSVIYQAAIWNRALSASERAAWYGSGNGFNFKRPATIFF